LHVNLDDTIGPFDTAVDADVLRQFGAAAIVTQIFEAENGGRAALVPDELKRAATGGVHGEHDVVVHRPITAGEPLRTWVSGHGARPAGRNALVTLRYATHDGDGDLVAEQWWTTVWLGTTCRRVGAAAPDHAFPEDARRRPIGEHVVEIDADMPRRYAEVSGDWSAHHFDADAARRSGFDRPFVHGLCTMALCAQGVGDADRVRRVAGRFASPTFLGEELRVRYFDAGPLGVAFEAESAGAVVISHGRIELR
jgi:acyl dehydratase